MKGTRILALVLAALLLVGIVPAAVAEDEPVHISVAGYMFGPIDNDRDVITPLVEQQLKEKHGINVDIEVVYIEQANYSEILNTRLTGDQAPDVFLAQSATMLNTYYDQGLIKTWSKEFFQENAPDVYEFIVNGAAYGDLAGDVEAWWKAAMKDGEMVVLPSFKPDGSMPYKTLLDDAFRHRRPRQQRQGRYLRLLHHRHEGAVWLLRPGNRLQRQHLLLGKA